MKNLIDIKELSVKDINDLIKVANKIIDKPSDYSHKCSDKILVATYNFNENYNVNYLFSQVLILHSVTHTQSTLSQCVHMFCCISLLYASKINNFFL